MKKNFIFEIRIVILINAIFWLFSGLIVGEYENETFPAVFNLANLNGKNGFAINGIDIGNQSGYAVSGTADVNGDGIDDILISAIEALNKRGQSYVVFGQKEAWPAVINLSGLNGKNGFAINGTNVGNQSGFSVSGAGDVNGDGIADILIGTKEGSQSYVVFGSKKVWPAVVILSQLNGNDGFLVKGIHTWNESGVSVSGTGDVNGDGIDDILIAAPKANGYIGQSYVVFGKKEAWPAVINLGDLNGNNGFVINSVKPDGFSVSPLCVSGAGDVNGDGIADILIGASDALGGGTGQSYVVFGSQRPSAVINLEDLNGQNGFQINAIDRYDGCGHSVSGAGDVNGDGIDDILISAPYAKRNVGQSYIVFGSKQPWSRMFNLRWLDGKDGFIINGISEGSMSGFSVSGAGDVNGDSIDDILIGAPLANDGIGQGYVVYGSQGSWPAVINLAGLNGNNGFIINGINRNDNSNFSIRRAGDVNADGIADILIGAFNANNKRGQSYIIFGEHE